MNDGNPRAPVGCNVPAVGVEVSQLLGRDLPPALLEHHDGCLACRLERLNFASFEAGSESLDEQIDPVELLLTHLHRSLRGWKPVVSIYKFGEFAMVELTPRTPRWTADWMQTEIEALGHTATVVQDTCELRYGLGLKVQPDARGVTPNPHHTQ